MTAPARTRPRPVAAEGALRHAHTHADEAPARVVDALPYLTEEDREILQRRASAAVYGKGDLIIEEGAQQRALYVVSKGIVRVERAHLARGVAVAHLGPGDTFGEMSLLEGASASATVIAEEDVHLQVLRADDLGSLLASVPGFESRFYHSLATTLSRRLRATSAQIPALMVEDVPQVNRFHAQRTGHQTEAPPADLVDVVEDFKTVMLATDGGLKNDKLHPDEAQARVSAACSSVNAALRHHAASMPKNEKGIGAYVFRETFSYFMLSRFLDRAFTKPRGYGGDCGTMELLQANQADGDGRLGALIDRWALSLPSVHAIRERHAFVRGIIREIAAQWAPVQPMPITSLGCGRARELFDFILEESDPNVRALGIDMDPEALGRASEFAARCGLDDRIAFAQDNLVRLAQGRGKIRVQPQQLVYGTGFADYLTDDRAVSLLDWIHGILLPGGTVMIGGFDDVNPDRAFFDHILEWQLVHRAVEPLRQLFARSRFHACKVEVRTDPGGIQHYALARKGG